MLSTNYSSILISRCRRCCCRRCHCRRRRRRKSDQCFRTLYILLRKILVEQFLLKLFLKIWIVKILKILKLILLLRHVLKLNLLLRHLIRCLIRNFLLLRLIRLLELRSKLFISCLSSWLLRFLSLTLWR